MQARTEREATERRPHSRAELLAQLDVERAHAFGLGARPGGLALEVAAVRALHRGRRRDLLRVDLGLDGLNRHLRRLDASAVYSDRAS